MERLAPCSSQPGLTPSDLQSLPHNSCCASSLPLSKLQKQLHFSSAFEILEFETVVASGPTSVIVQEGHGMSWLLSLLLSLAGS